MSSNCEIKLQPDYITKHGEEYHVLYNNYYKHLVLNKNRKINFNNVKYFCDNILSKDKEDENTSYYDNTYYEFSDYEEIGNDSDYLSENEDIKDDESEHSDSDFNDEVTLSKKYYYNSN
jgi:hypothetical protein